MKKIICLITIIICIGFVGCSGQVQISDGKIETPLGDINVEVGDPTFIPSEQSDVASTSSPSPTPSPSPTASPQIISAGEMISNESQEITINSVSLSYKVEPSDTSGFYTYYTASEGNVFIDVDMSVKNLQKQDLSCDEIFSITADYNNGYIYKGFPIVNDATTGFTYANISVITPLETKGMHYLIECPQEVEESNLPLFLLINLDGITYQYLIR